MSQFAGKLKTNSSSLKRHFKVLMGDKEHGLYVSSTPSSAAKKVVTKLCAANKSKKVEFYIREITQGSKKKTYGPYIGHIQKLKEPIELKGHVIQYKPIVKLRVKMIGGGYYGNLSISMLGSGNTKYNMSGQISDILESEFYDRNTNIIFTITNIENNEVIHYKNIECLGQGTYGKIFLINNMSDQKKYVIKIFLVESEENQNKEFEIESRVLNSFMNRIKPECQYKFISKGETNIAGNMISFIVFPFKGELNLLKVIDEEKFEIIPEILNDVISCLIEINKYAFHGDLKLENIAYDSDTKTGFIIDYGLSILFPIELDKLNEIIIGNMQISIEIIIAYLLKINSNNTNNTNSNNSNNSNNNSNNNNTNNSNNDIVLTDLYQDCLDDIQKTIDNFGLFWLILDSILGKNIDEKYIKDSPFIIEVESKKLPEKCLNFYFNLDNSKKSRKMKKKIIPIFKYVPNPKLKKKFIKHVRKSISAEKFTFYFKDKEQLYIDFMEKLLGLVRIDPKTRIPKETLLEDEFFQINYESNVNEN